MTFDRLDLTDSALLNIYKHLLKPRMIEEKMLILLRQGQIGKWFSGIGQEAIAVGCTLAMHADEYILPMHRNLGVFTSREIPLSRLMGQWQGKNSGFTQGRDRSFHFGSKEFHIVGMISHLGAQLAVADGIALADVIRADAKATLVFTGEGGTSEGDFHEALNVAAVWDLPVLFVIENNAYGLSTPTHEQYRCKQLADRAIGYGIDGYRIDGNNILEVFHTINRLAQDIRQNPRPILIECMTFRMRGHEEASGTKYIPPELFIDWEKKDPLKNYENYLLKEGIITERVITDIKQELKNEIETALEVANAAEDINAHTKKELNDMYALNDSPTVHPKNQRVSSEMRYIDAISDALRQSMRNSRELVIMGQDIAEYGGAFKITQGFLEEFGKARIRNTPICESAIIGAGLGLSINGGKSVIEMQFADFVSCGFNQIINNLAKTHYRWGEKADVVVRMPTGAGTGAGPFHSQSNEAWFTKTPGLKVVYPAFPSDAKGLLNAAIADPNPVIYFEHKYLYRSISEPVPDEYYTLEIGKAKLIREGWQLSIISYGLGVHWALEYLNKNPDLSADLLDLRSLQPWDKIAVESSVKKTGKVLILHEDTLTCGFGAEISAHLAEHCFEFLDAPIKRCASLDTAIPMNKALEDNFLANARFEQQVKELIEY